MNVFCIEFLLRARETRKSPRALTAISDFNFTSAQNPMPATLWCQARITVATVRWPMRLGGGARLLLRSSPAARSHSYLHRRRRDFHRHWPTDDDIYVSLSVTELPRTLRPPEPQRRTKACHARRAVSVQSQPLEGNKHRCTQPETVATQCAFLPSYAPKTNKQALN